ncbi:MAG: alpha/beta hydrolase [Rhodospirillaceae bacterium]|jgi:acetyl esterase/lipase|nr:alpha/beta hydrolase [Rhodospirillaceae bacterium]
MLFRKVRSRVAFGFLAACCALPLATPAPAQQAVKVAGVEARVLRDFAYGADDDQRMDVYLPAAATKDAPAILMVHGGGWKRGDKAMDRVVDNKVARWLPKGIAFISVNYPMVPEADPVVQADNVARALAKAQAEAAGWGLDPARFVLMGHSAGAHLVTLLNADPVRATRQGAKPWIGVVSLDSGALDVPEIMTRRHNELYDDAFGADPAFWKAVSPQHQLKAGGAPWLGVCSDMIRDSCPENRAYADRAQSLGLRAEVLPEKLRHGEINYTLGEPGAYTDAVEAFLASLDPQVKALLGK